MFTGIYLLQRNVWDFFSTKDIFGKFVEFNLLKGGAEGSHQNRREIEIVER